MNYREAIDWLFSTQMFGIKLGLDGARHLLKEYLAYPAHDTQVIHVAGTNGKGSTCAMIDSIARACGRRTGLFTSPHLIDYRERIKVSGQEIPEDACAAMLTALREICERLETHPTFFEITLALAMRWFRERECELIVLGNRHGRQARRHHRRARRCLRGHAHRARSHAVARRTRWRPSPRKKPAFSSPANRSSPHRRNRRPDSCWKRRPTKRAAPIEFIEEPLFGYPIALRRRAPEMERRARRRRPAPRRAVRSTPTASATASPRSPGPDASRKSCPASSSMARTIRTPPAFSRRLGNPNFPEKKPRSSSAPWPPRTSSGILEILAPLASRIFLCPVDTPRAVPAEELAGSLPADAPPHETFATFEAAFAAARSHSTPILVAGSLFLVGEARAFLTHQHFQPSSQ